jgi:hypothetical protein
MLLKDTLDEHVTKSRMLNIHPIRAVERRERELPTRMKLRVDIVEEKEAKSRT